MTTKVLPPDWGAMGEAAKLFTRSLMMGLDSAVRKNEFAELTAEDVENLPYAEAVEYLKKRDVIKKVDYNKLSDKMRFRAFTASRIADGDLLKRINSELIKNVNDGKGLKDFLSLTKTDILNKVGMGAGGQGWYWETVYRTNVQTAYNTGRMMGFEEDTPLALHFVGIEDSRQTDVCHSLSNVIRPYDDPLWEKYIPPLHFGCRSTVRAIYDEDELPEEWSSLEGIEKPAKGFGTNPLENDSWWNELSSQVARAKEYGVQGEIDIAKAMLISDFESYQKLLSEKGMTLSLEVANLDKEILAELNGVISDIGIPEITNSIKVTAPVTTNIAALNYKGELKLNALYMQNKTKLLKELNEGIEKGFYPKNCNALKSTLYHELFGHGAERFLLKYDSNYTDKVTAWKKCFVAENIVNEALANILKTNPNLESEILRKQICLYALDSYSETMAYGLEDIYTNKDNAQLLSKEIYRVTIKHINDTLRRLKI